VVGQENVWKRGGSVMGYRGPGLLIAALAAGLAACAEREPILPGERLDPRSPLVASPDGAAPLDGTEAAVAEEAGPAAILAGTTDVIAGATPVAIALPAQVANAEWTHRGGSAQHRIAHAALGQGLARVWGVNAGAGDSRKNRIGADPVVAGGRVYTLDALGQVVATSTGAGRLWAADLTPPSDRSGDASGGGLAVDGGTVFATTGFGELVALDAGTGGIRWRQRFDAAVGGAPTVADGTVYVVTRNGGAYAVAADTGRLRWQVPGTGASAGIVGASAPAVSGELVLFPFASGQILAVQRDTGAPVWQAYVAGKRLGRAFASVTDLTGDPVVADGVIYAGTSAGRLAALSATTGERLWAADDGAVSPPVVAGGAVFIVTDENQLMRIDAATGATVWRIDMPYFLRDRDRRRQEIFAHFGPVLAGGRLFVASGEGALKAFDASSGALVGSVAIPGGGAASAPVVAGGTLYVLSRNGQLHAFR
jgi:outer membrane protein assembly factor BamB